MVEDAVVTARVLPSNGLTDLLEIAGRRVAASLPPTVRPGDALQVRVTGFDGDRILLQIVAHRRGRGRRDGSAEPAAAPDPARDRRRVHLARRKCRRPRPDAVSGRRTTVTQSGTPAAPPRTGPARPAPAR